MKLRGTPRWAGLLLLAFASVAWPAERTAPSARWEPDIQAFEAADQKNPPPPGGVLFVGSSSIRMWTNLSQDFPRHAVIRRGFGGSQMSDLLAYAERIVLPYKPRVIVLYEGDNDLAAGKKPAEVLKDYQRLVGRVQAELPRTRVLFIAVKPSLARWKLADEIRETNRLIREYSEREKNLTFVDVFTPMLNAEGKPRADLLIKDGLHMNAQGYQLWARLIEPLLDHE